jgi:hypothetical protein
VRPATLLYAQSDSQDLLRRFEPRAGQHSAAQEQNYKQGEDRKGETVPTVAWLADTVSRFLIGLVASAFLTVPMVFLMRQAFSRSNKVATVVVCVLVFSLFVALASRAGPQGMMAASAAYAAVSVFFFVSTSEKGGDAFWGVLLTRSAEVRM